MTAPIIFPEIFDDDSSDGGSSGSSDGTSGSGSSSTNATTPSQITGAVITDLTEASANIGFMIILGILVFGLLIYLVVGKLLA
ncbi:hypothetical protein HY492_04020 [Candidatus Woesearchaeota archaeon]|nr:hypothetical protein [Candidatus Woesearchaeota archaeon]